MKGIAQRLPLLAVLAAVSLYFIAAGCKSGDDDVQPTLTTSAINSAGVTKTPLASARTSPTKTNGSLAHSSPNTGDRQVEVLDSGFTALRGGIQGGFIAHNKNQTEAVETNFSVVDSAGAPFSGAHGSLVLMPDETLGIAFSGSYAPADAPVAGIDVQLVAPQWSSAPSTDHLTTTITSTETQSIAGTVTNPFSFATQGLWMHVLTYNAAGKIIGGSTVGLDSVPANGSAIFTAQVPFVGDDYANNARVEAYAEFRDLPTS